MDNKLLKIFKPKPFFALLIAVLVIRGITEWVCDFSYAKLYKTGIGAFMLWLVQDITAFVSGALIGCYALLYLMWRKKQEVGNFKQNL